jgi:hypothetical protein
VPTCHCLPACWVGCRTAKQHPIKCSQLNLPVLFLIHNKPSSGAREPLVLSPRPNVFWVGHQACSTAWLCCLWFTSVCLPLDWHACVQVLDEGGPPPVVSCATLLANVSAFAAALREVRRLREGGLQNVCCTACCAPCWSLRVHGGNMSLRIPAQFSEGHVLCMSSLTCGRWPASTVT